MTGKRSAAGRALLIVLVVTLLLTQFALAVPLPVVAEGPGAGEDSPVNPAFESWLQSRNITAAQGSAQSAQSSASGLQTGERPLGLVPRTVDLRHLNRIPVTAAARAQSRAVAGPQAASSGAQTAGSGTVGLPATFDWRTRGRVTPVRNQSSCGTCWAFGTLASFESSTWIQAGSQNDFSEQNLVCCTDPSWTYLAANRCGAGGWDFIAVDTLIKKGVRLETCDPYNTSAINTEACRGCDTSYKATGFRTVCETAAGNEAAIKDAIYNFGPVEAAFYYSGGTVYNGYIIHNPGSGSGRNHLICIVGWDDTFAYGGTTGAWIIKNSWGTLAGQGGYYYMTYGSSNLGDVGYFASVSAADPNETIYYYDEAGYITSRGYGGSSAWMANVFSATQAGRLNAADFWTTSNNAQYVIYVYNGQFGSVLATQSGTCAEEGYYSIPLTTTVNLNAGQQFTVAVKMTTLGYNYPLPVERVWSGYCNPPIQTGVSFGKHYDGDAWADLGATAQRNACLRARIKINTIPSAPVLSSPVNGSSSSGTEVIFRWSASTGATQYLLQVNTNSEFTGMELYDSVVTSASQSVPGFTSTGNTYYWRIYAGNAGDQWSIPSEVWSFVNTDSQRFLGPEDSVATSTTSPDYFILDRFAANTTGNIASIRIKCGSSGNVKVAIYADSAGSPGALLNAVNSGTSVSPGWNSIPIASTSVNAGTYYWVSFIMDTSCVSYRQEGNTTRWFKPVAYSGFTFPPSAGSGFTTSYTVWYDHITAWGTVN